MTHDIAALIRASGPPIADSKQLTETAERLHAQLIKRLTKYGTGKVEEKLLTKLAACTPMSRCVSAACPLCTHTLQAVMTGLIQDVRSYGIGLDACVTIVPLTRLPVTEYVSSDVETAVKKLKRFELKLDRVFEASGISHVIGCIDIDSSEFPDGEFQEHRKPHLHAIAFLNQVEAGERDLRRQFRNKGSVNRAVFIKGFDGSDSWLQYVFKYSDRRRLRRKDDAGKWMEPSYKSLTVQQQLQQARLLDEVGWPGRIYLKGVKLVRSAQTWRLVLTDFTPEVRRLK